MYTGGVYYTILGFGKLWYLAGSHANRRRSIPVLYKRRHSEITILLCIVYGEGVALNPNSKLGLSRPVDNVY